MLALLGLSACSGGGGSSTPESMANPQVSQAPDIVITPSQNPASQAVQSVDVAQNPSPGQTPSQNQNSNTDPGQHPSNTPPVTPICQVGMVLNSSRTGCVGDMPFYSFSIRWRENFGVWTASFSGTTSEGYSAGTACLEKSGFVATRAADSETWTIRQLSYPDLENNDFGVSCDDF